MHTPAQESTTTPEYHNSSLLGYTIQYETRRICCWRSRLVHPTAIRLVEKGGHAEPLAADPRFHSVLIRTLEKHLGMTCMHDATAHF